MDKIFVTIIGIVLILCIYWFFLLGDDQKEDLKEDKHHEH